MTLPFSQILLVVIFSASCVYHVYYPLTPVRKCNNLRDLYELPDFWPPNSPDLNPVNYKISASSLPEKAQDVNDLRRHLIDVRVGVKQSVIDDAIDR